MSYVLEIPVGECRLEFLNCDGKKLSESKKEGDVLRTYMFELSGPNIDSNKVLSVEIPELDYMKSDNKPLMYKVEFSDESGYQKGLNKEYQGMCEIDCGDLKVVFYSYDGHPYKIGKEDSNNFVRPWMFEIKSEWVPTLKVRNVKFPKLSVESKDSVKIDIKFELMDGEPEYFKLKGK